ncbi:predicted protein [Pyrenophora tritici-repentis Pt-1C-BFP]|uniref:Uncharacterized protein n=1 Tax=Pyrenophora tritici-repentis (strain Pt-1C-BFP) TaxID=426418 RepID=B2W1C0_PYRTR|nr:uncharacterized protein PTRG_04255 [Pyrenophora tritici-repentis Pt-1C-BFP]EDU47093.1 predicted protein [Pyrenophora tritici-repentis Pt-1C-BFP]
MSLPASVVGAKPRSIPNTSKYGGRYMRYLLVAECDQWKVYPVLDMRVTEPVNQFVFSQDERYLLISGVGVYSFIAILMKVEKRA